MSDKSGIDLLEEILYKLEKIEQQIKVQDQNIKRIANTANLADLISKASGTDISNWSAANKTVEKPKKRFEFVSSDASKMKQDPGKRRGAKAVAAGPPSKKKKSKSIMCQGKMLLQDKNDVIPLPGISVRIFNEKDVLVKETKTNRAGHWMSQLPPGKYIATYEGSFKGKQLVPINKIFEVPHKLPEGQTFVEVI